MKKAMSLLLSVLLIISMSGCAKITTTVFTRKPAEDTSTTPSDADKDDTDTTTPNDSDTTTTTSPTVKPTTGAATSGTVTTPTTVVNPTDTAPADVTVDLVLKNAIAYNAYVRDESNYQVFYVDSKTGSDKNTGRSPSEAWKTLLNVNRTDFEPGTKILLKRGSVFNEPLVPCSSGTDGKYFIIDAYGEGDKPIINGDGESAAVTLSNLSYIELRNLQITNQSDFDSNRIGVSVRGGGQLSSTTFREGGMTNHVYLINLDVHDISCTEGSRFYGGIVFYSSQAKNPTAFTDVLVQGCSVTNTGGAGIVMASDYENGPAVRWSANAYYPSQNVCFRGNYIAHCASDGIFQSAANNVLMEYNTVVDTSYAQGAYAGMWPHYSSNVVMQYNEVYDTKLVGGDGQGFDVDIDCVHTVVQYNYSHDNGGGFILLCTDGTDNAYNTDLSVRYNVSQNDKGQIFTLSGPISDVKVYNNTIYTASGTTNLVGSYDWGSGKSPADARFSNNIFYMNTTGKSNLIIPSRIVFDTNLFWGTYNFSNLPAVNTLSADPLFTNPGTGSIGLGTLSGYQLQSGSPCINAGLTISESCKKDFVGTPIPSKGKTDLGAFEYAG